MLLSQSFLVFRSGLLVNICLIAIVVLAVQYTSEFVPPQAVYDHFKGREIQLHGRANRFNATTTNQVCFVPRLVLNLHCYLLP